MVYPIFEINSIKTRCESDIEQFCSTFLKVKTGVADSIYKTLAPPFSKVEKK
jgi:hypothetical protein